MIKQATIFLRWYFLELLVGGLGDPVGVGSIKDARLIYVVQ
jgi:hypothetical protein